MSHISKGFDEYDQLWYWCSDCDQDCAEDEPCSCCEAEIALGEAGLR